MGHEDEIRRVIEEWHRRTAQGDLDSVLDMMAEDAVFFRCGHPPMSKAEFATGFREWAGKMRIESKSDIKEVHTSGDLAYAWSYTSIVMTMTDTGARTTREGHVLTVFRKSSSGRWLLARDANLLSA